MRLFICLSLFFATFFANTLSVIAKTTPETIKRPSSQELRNNEIKTYDTDNKLQVMKAVMNVLQDDYFFINQTDSKIGFIHASKEVDTKDPYTNIKETFGCSKKMTGIKRYSSAKEEVNINIETLNNTTSVRVHFRKKVLNMYDVEIRIKEMADKTYYDNFFGRLTQELKNNNVISNVKEKQEAPSLTNISNTTTSAKKSKKRNK